MSCSYCFYLEKKSLYRHHFSNDPHMWAMEEDVLRDFIRKYIDESPSRDVHFIWQGGEPLLSGLERFRHIVELQDEYAGTHQILNTLQTNGTLIDDDWVRFFRDHRFTVGLSIDGPAEMNDIIRKGGAASQVLEAARALNAAGVSLVSLTCVHARNRDHGADVYEFLREAGFTVQQYIPIVPRKPGMKDALLPGDYARFLLDIYGIWVARDVGSVFVQPFDLALEAWMGQPTHLCVFNRSCGAVPVIEKNGDLYSCDHFVDAEHRIGNIQQDSLMSMMTSPRQEAFAAEKSRNLHPDCHSCPWLFACHGGCPKDRIKDTEAGRQNFLCTDYQTLFNIIGPDMEYMAGELKNRRSPATVMQRKTL